MTFQVAAIAEEAALAEAWVSACWERAAEAAGFLHPSARADRQAGRDEDLKNAVFDSATRVLHPWLTASGEQAGVSWRNRAQREGVVFSAQMRSLDFDYAGTGLWCHEGQLDDRARLVLARILEEFTASESSVNFFWGTSAVVCGRPATLYRGAISDLPAIRASFRCWGSDDPIIGPESWWPDDRSWVVHTDYDSSATDVFGTSALGEHLFAQDGLETFSLWGADRRVRSACTDEVVVSRRRLG